MSLGTIYITVLQVLDYDKIFKKGKYPSFWAFHFHTACEFMRDQFFISLITQDRRYMLCFWDAQDK